MLTLCLFLLSEAGVTLLPTITWGQICQAVIYIVLSVIWLLKGTSKTEDNQKTIIEHEEVIKTQTATQHAQALLQARQQIILEQHGERIDRLEASVYKIPQD